MPTQRDMEWVVKVGHDFLFEYGWSLGIKPEWTRRLDNAKGFRTLKSTDLVTEALAEVDGPPVRVRRRRDWRTVRRT